MSSHEFKKVPCGKKLKESKLSSQNVRSNSSTEMVSQIREDSAKKKHKSARSDCLKSDAPNKILIESESVLKRKFKIYMDSPVKKKQITKSTHHIVNIHYNNDSESKIEKTPTKRKLKNLESIHQNVRPYLSSESPHELMKATCVKRLKMSTISPCSDIITRSKSQTVKLKEVSNHKKKRINKTNDQAISTYSKSEIPDNLVKAQSEKNVKNGESKHLNSSPLMKNEYHARFKGVPQKKLKQKRYCRRVCSRSETFSQLNGSLIQVEESRTSKLPVTESSTSEIEIKTPESILQNDPVSSKNGISDNLRQTENESLASVLNDSKQVLYEKTIFRGELLKDSNISVKNVRPASTILTVCIYGQGYKKAG